MGSEVSYVDLRAFLSARAVDGNHRYVCRRKRRRGCVCVSKPFFCLAWRREKGRLGDALNGADGLIKTPPTTTEESVSSCKEIWRFIHSLVTKMFLLSPWTELFSNVSCISFFRAWFSAVVVAATACSGDKA